MAGSVDHLDVLPGDAYAVPVRDGPVYPHRAGDQGIEAGERPLLVLHGRDLDPGPLGPVGEDLASSGGNDLRRRPDVFRMGMGQDEPLDLVRPPPHGPDLLEYELLRTFDP